MDGFPLYYKMYLFCKLKGTSRGGARTNCDVAKLKASLFYNY